METLKLEKSTAKKLYKSVPKWFQEILEKSFGEETFSGKITDRIKTFQDVLDNADPSDVKAYNMSKAAFLSNDELAYLQLKLIAKVLNEGWIPDWNDSNEQKWYPYFSLSSGFGFSTSYYGYGDSVTAVGSRLCFKTTELAQYAGEQFTDIYKQFLTINK